MQRSYKGYGIAPIAYWSNWLYHVAGILDHQADEQSGLADVVLGLVSVLAPMGYFRSRLSHLFNSSANSCSDRPLVYERSKSNFHIIVFASTSTRQIGRASCRERV